MDNEISESYAFAFIVECHEWALGGSRVISLIAHHNTPREDNARDNARDQATCGSSFYSLEK